MRGTGMEKGYAMLMADEGRKFGLLCMAIKKQLFDKIAILWSVITFEELYEQVYREKTD